MFYEFTEEQREYNKNMNNNTITTSTLNLKIDIQKQPTHKTNKQLNKSLIHTHHSRIEIQARENRQQTKKKQIPLKSARYNFS